MKAIFLCNLPTLVMNLGKMSAGSFILILIDNINSHHITQSKYVYMHAHLVYKMYTC